MELWAPTYSWKGTFCTRVRHSFFGPLLRPQKTPLFFFKSSPSSWLVNLPPPNLPHPENKALFRETNGFHKPLIRPYFWRRGALQDCGVGWLAIPGKGRAKQPVSSDVTLFFFVPADWAPSIRHVDKIFANCTAGWRHVLVKTATRSLAALAYRRPFCFYNPLGGKPSRFDDDVFQNPGSLTIPLSHPDWLVFMTGKSEIFLAKTISTKKLGRNSHLLLPQATAIGVTTQVVSKRCHEYYQPPKRYPGDSSRDLLIPKPWRSPTTSQRVMFSLPQKPAELPGRFYFLFVDHGFQPCMLLSFLIAVSRFLVGRSSSPYSSSHNHGSGEWVPPRPMFFTLEVHFPLKDWRLNLQDDIRILSFHPWKKIRVESFLESFFDSLLLGCPWKLVSWWFITYLPDFQLLLIYGKNNPFAKCHGHTTVDGRNPAPPGMYKTL